MFVLKSLQMRLKLFNRGFRFAASNLYKMMTDSEMPAMASVCCESSQEEPKRNQDIYEALKDSCKSNASYFQPDDTENGQRLYQGFMMLIDNIDNVWPLVDHLRKVAPFYDFDNKSPGNGYRSFVCIVDSCILHSLKLSHQISASKDTLLFRKSYFVKEIESCGQLLASLITCLKHLQLLLTWATPGELFPTSQHSPDELFERSGTINQYCFYGRCFGFQFLPSMRGILKGISICMAGFSEAYYSEGNLISSVWTGGQYLIDPELRAKRIVNISQSASVEFCKAFWFLAESEIMKHVPSLVASTVSVNKVITIPPEPITINTVDGKEMTISPPNVHIGLQPLNVRLINANKIKDVVDESSCMLPLTDGILFHCHGGGFVAQSSKSHEIYLREWAVKLNVPILSVDYSLAPQAPFPRALEEVFFAYCWMLNNFKELGTTGKRIVFAGDSAGGNLLTCCVLKILMAGVRRPEGLFTAYTPVVISFLPSPARLLSLMDPLLPFGFLLRCLKAYVGPCAKSKEDKQANKELTTPSLTSPLDCNTLLKVSPSQEGASEGPSSFEEVSPSDMAELQAHKSGSERRKSSDTTISAASLQSEHTATGATPTDDKNQNLASDFLERYVLDSDSDTEAKRMTTIKPTPTEESHREAESENSSTLIGEKPLLDKGTPKDKKRMKKRLSEAATGIMGAMSSKFAYITGSNNITRLPQDKTKKTTNLDALITRSESDDIMFAVPKDPLLSPYWADDALLKQFPPVRILSSHLDPCLDDCVMFAKKLKKLGNVVGIDVLEGLPHGFLNLSLVNKEANEGSMLCVERIKQLMDLNKDVPSPNDSNDPNDL